MLLYTATMFWQSTTKEVSEMIEDVPRKIIKKSAKYRARGNSKTSVTKIKNKIRKFILFNKIPFIGIIYSGTGRTSKIKSNNRVGK